MARMYQVFKYFTMDETGEKLNNKKSYATLESAIETSLMWINKTESWINSTVNYIEITNKATGEILWTYGEKEDIR